MPIANYRPTFGKRIATLAVALLAAVTIMFAGSAAGPVSNANALGFCTNVTLSPHGGQWDLCYAWPWESGRIWRVGVVTHDRAGCYTWAAVNSGQLQDNWNCVGNHDIGVKYVPNDGQNHRGVIRNNNTQNPGTFDGLYECCWTTP